MELEELQDYEPELDLDDDQDLEDQEWDEETLGLDWNEADERSLVREVIPGEGFAD